MPNAHPGEHGQLTYRERVLRHAVHCLDGTLDGGRAQGGSWPVEFVAVAVAGGEEEPGQQGLLERAGDHRP
jgi:hypothetical protein